MRHSRLVLVALLLAGLLVVPALPAADAYPVSTFKITGHGWGHGRGMGQWGSLGYAVDHGWNYEQILNHYYGGTSMGSTDNGQLGVQIKRMDGFDTIVQQERGELVIEGHAGFHGAALVRRVGVNSFQVYRASNCAGGPIGWQALGNPRPGPVVLRAANDSPDNDDHTRMLQLCDPAGNKRWYRGQIESHDHEGTHLTLNRVLLESYLRGVVPRESPAGWGDQGGGKGMHALRAQAVAARSYARAENRPGPADTCDTTACQVYLGRAEQVGGASFKHLEHANTDTAIKDTAGKIRTHNSTGGVARTEFSSSTGGWSAGGTFPVVEDKGDSIAGNPNHRWETTLAVSTVEAAYGKGALEGIEIRSRNGHGSMGGRVLSMRLAFRNGTVDVTGDEFRQKFALKSNWFDVSDAVGIASFPYHVVGEDGGVFSFGGAKYRGSLPEHGISTTVRGIAEGPGGYWILGHDGGVFSFGVPFHGSMGGQQLNQPVVGMAATVPAKGYWLVASDGGVFSFGDGRFFGSTGDIVLNQPMVGMAPTPSGGGYWLVARDGGIFSYGDAAFHGSTGAMVLNQPVVGMAPHPKGKGYWLLAADGGLFAFGVDFHGSLPGSNIAERAVGMAVSESGRGYLILTAEGNVYGFGDAASGGGPRNFGSIVPSAGIGAER